MKTIIDYFQPNCYVDPITVKSDMVSLIETNLPLLVNFFGKTLVDELSYEKSRYNDMSFYTHYSSSMINLKFAEFYPEYQI